MTDDTFRRLTAGCLFLVVITYGIFGKPDLALLAMIAAGIFYPRERPSLVVSVDCGTDTKIDIKASGMGRLPI